MLSYDNVKKVKRTKTISKDAPGTPQLHPSLACLHEDGPPGQLDFKTNHPPEGGNVHISIL